MSSIGVVFPAHAPADELPAFAERVEALGYAELWVIEDCFLSGGIALASTALAVTDRLRIGIGLLPALVRNPAILAMDIATLARLHPGRLTVTLGHGVESWMAQIGARPARRLRALAEVTAAVRMLLAGETANVAGSHVDLASVTLASPPDVAPQILIGTTGPKGIALAGRSADGLLLPEGCGPKFIAGAKDVLSKAARLPAPPHEIVVYAWLRIGDDEPARALLRDAVVHWVEGGLFPGPMAAAGVERSPGPEPIRRGLASELGIVGNATQCLESVGQFRDAGADRLVLAAIGPDYDAQYQQFADEVLPLLDTLERELVR